MQQLYKYSIVLLILTILGLSSTDQLYAQKISNRTFAPDGVSIVGGEKADPGEYPWQVALMEYGEQYCGGTLIAPDWVLTAAHCVEYGADQVMLGAHQLDKEESTHQIIDVSQIVVHPDYDTYTIDSDIALLKLAQPATLNDRVQTIDLLQNQAEAGTLSTIIGWGTTSEMGSPSSVLREVSVPLVSHAMCDRVYEGEITENMICAGQAMGGKDSCYGDSGGPLMVSDGGDGWLQAGIVSWGEGCALMGSYGVYTNVPQFLDWIQSYLDRSTKYVDSYWYEVAAQVMGLDMSIFQSELDSGQSIADIASANSIDLQSIIDAIQAAEEASIQQLLADGTIIQQEADDWIAVLPELMDIFVNQTLYNDDWWGGFPDDLDYVDWDQVAVDTIGTDWATYLDQWFAGQSIANIAIENGVDPQAIIDAIAAAEMDLIQQDVEVGYLTQEEADEWLDILLENVDKFVYKIYINWDMIAAQTIGIDIDTFYEMWWARDMSIAEIALEYDVEPQSVTDAIIAAEVDAIQQMIATGYETTQEETDAWIASLAEVLPYYLDDSLFYDEYWEDIEEMDDATSDSDEADDEAPSDDSETGGESESSEVSGEGVPTEPNSEEENNTLGGIGDDGSSDESDGDADNPTETDSPGEASWVDWFEVAAQTLNMGIDPFFDAMDQGQSVAEIAANNGTDSKIVIDEILREEQEMIKQNVTDGLFSQKKAGEWLAELPEIVAHFVEDSAGCTNVGMIDGVDWFAVTIESIGVDREKFWITVDQGQNIAEIAQANGTDSQVVINAIVSAETKQVGKQIVDGLITQADAGEWLTDIDTFVAEFVNMQFTNDDSEVGAQEVGGSNAEAPAKDQSMPTATIAAAGMTLDLYKNARTKTPAAFYTNSGSNIYLPMVMK